jgi:hypothetical protein
LDYTIDVLHMMSNVSALTNVKWYLGTFMLLLSLTYQSSPLRSKGIPFNDTNDLHLDIVEYGEQLLGDSLLGFQAGNEPDQYARHNRRQANYSVWDYFGEIQTLVSALGNDTRVSNKNLLIAPSVSGTWYPEDVWNTNFIPTYQSSLYALAVEKYPTDNCAMVYPNAGFIPHDAQTVFSDFLNHTSGQLLVAPYLNSTAIAQANGKPFIMFETNTVCSFILLRRPY